MISIDWLLSRFAAAGDRPYIVWRDRPSTYETLLEEVARWRTRLDAASVPRNAVVAVEADYSPTVVALLLVLIERSSIVVPLTASVRRHREEFLAVSESQWIISVGEDDAAVITPMGREVTNALTLQLRTAGGAGLVLFSSGSTGKSKAALHDFGRLLEKFQPKRHAFVTATFLLLDHIGGINTLLYVLSNAGTIVALDSRDPDVVCAAIARHRIELLPTSPTFLNLMLVSEAYRRHDLSSLKRVTYGTEVMPEETLRRIREAIPRAEFQQTYGLSELGILRSKSKSSDSLFVKLGGEGFEVKVVESTLWIRARSAMLGYLNAPSPFDSEGWFNTGDAVETDGDYVRILGRRSEMINVGGLKVFPSEVESVLLQIPNVRDASVVGEKNPLTGQIVTARLNLYETEALPLLRARVREYCKARLASYKIPVKIVIVDDAQHSERFKKMRRADEPGPSGA